MKKRPIEENEFNPTNTGFIPKIKKYKGTILFIGGIIFIAILLFIIF